MSWQGSPVQRMLCTFHLQRLSPKEGKYCSFMCLKSPRDPCVFTPKKGPLGICISLVQKEENRLIKEAQQRRTPEPPLGSMFPALWVGTVGNSATSSPDLASWHLGASPNPQWSTFLSPCYASSTVFQTCYH